MEKFTISDPVKGCDFTVVECDYATIQLTITEDHAPPQKLDVRVFHPPDIDGKPFGEWVHERIERLTGQTEDDDERCFYAEVLMMVGISRLRPTLDRKRERRFNLCTLDTSETLKELAATTRSEGKPVRDRLVLFAGEPSTPSRRLLQEALYVRPDLTIPLADKHYREFREQFFQEMAHTVETINEIESKVLSDMQKQLESRSDLTDAERSAALARLEAMRADSAPHDGWIKSLELVFKKALEMEDQGSGKFMDLVEKARELQAPVATEVCERGIAMLAEDDETFTPEYAECITRTFDVNGANNLLDAAIQRYEQLHRIPRGIVVSLTDWPLDVIASDDDPSVCAEEGTGSMSETAEPEVPVEWEQYAGFVDARESDDIFDKWYAVGWITTNLVNRNECIRLLQREAENVFEGVLDYGFRLVYRKIRHRLTYLERRVFKLMYFRQPLFAYHIAAMNPVIHSFFAGMDADTQLLILAVLVLKRREIDDRKDIARELERRWRAYLRFYPYWLDIVRTDDREDKRAQTVRNKTLSLDKPLGVGKNGTPFTLGDLQPDRRAEHSNLLEALAAQSDATVTNWAAAYCTAIQARHVARFAAGATESQIAQDEGITQPAVSQSIKAALSRIRKGLIRDGVITEN